MTDYCYRGPIVVRRWWPDRSKHVVYRLQKKVVWLFLLGRAVQAYLVGLTVDVAGAYLQERTLASGKSKTHVRILANLASGHAINCRSTSICAAKSEFLLGLPGTHISCAFDYHRSASRWQRLDHDESLRCLLRAAKPADSPAVAAGASRVSRLGPERRPNSATTERQMQVRSQTRRSPS